MFRSWCTLPCYSSRSHRTSSSLCEPTQRRIPADCCPAACNWASAATMPEAKLHSSDRPRLPLPHLALFALVPLLLVPQRREFGATTACFGRTPLAEILTAFHSILKVFLETSAAGSSCWLFCERPATLIRRTYVRGCVNTSLSRHVRAACWRNTWLWR